MIFEPNPKNMEWIRRQVQLNALNIEAVQAAVSDREGEAVFQDHAGATEHLVMTRYPASQKIKYGNRKCSVSPTTFAIKAAIYAANICESVWRKCRRLDRTGSWSWPT